MGRPDGTSIWVDVGPVKESVVVVLLSQLGEGVIKGEVHNLQVYFGFIIVSMFIIYCSFAIASIFFVPQCILARVFFECPVDCFALKKRIFARHHLRNYRSFLDRGLCHMQG